MLTLRRPLLGVNIDHVATLRQARGGRAPEPVDAALIAERAGADGITVHLREDRRHIQDHDVERLRALIATRLNLEMAVTDEMLGIAERIAPTFCCLVPEKRQELTTEGGLAVAGDEERIGAACRRLAAAGILVSLFIDPEPAQIRAAAAAGAPFIELHTGAYADATSPAQQMLECERLHSAAAEAAALGLRVNAGHGLDYHNVEPIAAITTIEELNIGHAIIARAVMVGLERAVRDMLALLRQSRY